MQELKHLLPYDFPGGSVPEELPKRQGGGNRNQSKTSLTQNTSQKRFSTLKQNDYLRPYTSAILDDPMVRRRPGLRAKVIPQTYFDTVEQHRQKLRP